MTDHPFYVAEFSLHSRQLKAEIECKWLFPFEGERDFNVCSAQLGSSQTHAATPCQNGSCAADIRGCYKGRERGKEEKTEEKKVERGLKKSSDQISGFFLRRRRPKVYSLRHPDSMKRRRLSSHKLMLLEDENRFKRFREKRNPPESLTAIFIWRVCTENGWKDGKNTTSKTIRDTDYTFGPLSSM